MIDEATNTELLVMIDEFINDISSQTIIETSVVIDMLLDMRNLTERTIVPI